jgi:hypothetical protein
MGIFYWIVLFAALAIGGGIFMIPTNLRKGLWQGFLFFGTLKMMSWKSRANNFYVRKKKGISDVFKKYKGKIIREKPENEKKTVRIPVKES